MPLGLLAQKGREEDSERKLERSSAQGQEQ